MRPFLILIVFLATTFCFCQIKIEKATIQLVPNTKKQNLEITFLIENKGNVLLDCFVGLEVHRPEGWRPFITDITRPKMMGARIIPVKTKEKVTIKHNFSIIFSDTVFPLHRKEKLRLNLKYIDFNDTISKLKIARTKGFRIEG